jgi:RodZ C-terminal domain
METLLIVLVIGCALAFVVQVGRGIWARARTVERHQQALDTLAGLTQRPEGDEDSSGGTAEHQAHVRLIGPGGQSASRETAALPPPRALPSSAPFRRPSRIAPSLPPSLSAGSSSAAIEPMPIEPGTVELAPIEIPIASAPLPPGPRGARSNAGSETVPLIAGAAPVMAGNTPPPPVRLSTTAEPVQETMPGLPPRPVSPQPAPPAVFVEPPTVPVPIVQPQVFYFDDLSSRAEGADGPERKTRRLGRHRRRNDVTAEHLLPAMPPPPVFSVNETAPGRGPGRDGPAAGGGNGRSNGGRKSVLGLVLATAAICVAVAAIGLTIVGLPGQGSPGAQDAAKSGPPSSATHEQRPTTVPAKSTTTTAAPPKPAVLVSSQNGTATYELSSASASIVVSASGPCWLEVRANSPLGQIVYEGTLEAGVHFSVTGPAWIRLGNPPAVAVKVNGTPMTVPGSQLAEPVNLQFTFG